MKSKVIFSTLSGETRFILEISLPSHVTAIFPRMSPFLIGAAASSLMLYLNSIFFAPFFTNTAFTSVCKTGVIDFFVPSFILTEDIFYCLFLAQQVYIRQSPYQEDMRLCQICHHLFWHRELRQRVTIRHALLSH